jgi:DNA-binding MarR family transcriptional regulator
MATPERQALIEETIGQMRRFFSRTLAQASKTTTGVLPMLPHMALHIALKLGGATQGELAEFLGVSQGYVTGLVDQLEEQGLVRRQRDPIDRRIVHVRGTLRGRRAHHRTHAQSHVAISTLFDGWSDEDIRTFQALLGRLGSTPVPPSQVVRAPHPRVSLRARPTRGRRTVV